MAIVQVNGPLVLTLTFTCLLTVLSAHHLGVSSDAGRPIHLHRTQDYYTDEAELPEGEEKKVELKELVEYTARSKRYPIHLDPQFGSAFKISGGECPKSADGQTKFFCPFPTRTNGRFVCLEEWELCDGVKNCPDASDETPSNCLFYKVMQSQLQTLVSSQREREEEERRAKTLEKMRQSFS